MHTRLFLHRRGHVNQGEGKVECCAISSDNLRNRRSKKESLTFRTLPSDKARRQNYVLSFLRL